MAKYLYAATQDGPSSPYKLQKRNEADYSLVQEINTTERYYALVVDEDYVYGGGGHNGVIYKRNACDLSLVASASTATSNINTMIIYDDYIYVGGGSRIYKYDKDLNYITGSTLVYGYQYKICAHNGYIYSNTDSTHIGKFDLDLNLITTSPTILQTQFVLYCDDNYLFYTSSNRIYRINPSTLAFVDYTTSPAGTDVWGLTTIGTNLYVVYNEGDFYTGMLQYDSSMNLVKNLRIAGKNLYKAYHVEKVNNDMYFGNTKVIKVDNNLNVSYSASTPSILYFGNTLKYGELTAITCTITTEDVTYFMGDDGTIGFSSIAGGNPNNYDTSIDGGLTWQSTSGNSYITYYGLTAGTYNCKIRNSLATTCETDFGDIVINQPIPTPHNLIVSGITYTSGILDWDFDDDTGVILIQVYNSSTYTWVSVESVDAPTSFFDLTDLMPQTEYLVRVALLADNQLYPSNEVLFSTLPFPISFCNADNQFSIINSTCGNSNGSIVINDSDYLMFFDFSVADINGNQHALTGLTADYYTLTATPKAIYQYHYGYRPCIFNWIEIIDTNTPMILSSIVVKPEQCGPFDVQAGRIYYSVTGLTVGHLYNFIAYKDDGSIYYQKTGCTTTEEFILQNAKANCYWVVITDTTSNCHLLVSNKCVTSIPFFSLGGIRKIWIAPWNNNLDYNYWSTKDDDYFLEFEDTSFFTSTKIKEYLSITGGTIQWYILPVANKVVKLDQKLTKVRQGYIFTDSLNVAISKANAQKWTEIQTLVNPNNKWVFIALDENNNYWTGGYRHGAEIKTYSFTSGAIGEDNGYQITITSQSENKILTSVDADYVINNVI